MAEIATQVAADGAAVLYGRCDEEPLASYQPFTEALERAAEDGVLPVAALPEVHAAELTRMLPRLAAADGAPPARARLRPRAGPLPHVRGGPRGARLRQRRPPALVVLDDVQWADAGGLALLNHLAAACATSAC